MKHTCPACQSLNTTLATGQFGKPGFQAYKNRICGNCGTAWRPQSPKWLGIVLIALGVAIPMMMSSVAKIFSDVDNAMGKPDQAQHRGDQNWIYLVAGGAAVLAGLAALFGDVGKMKILGKIEKKRK